jgi:hypothetical protein
MKTGKFSIAVLGMITLTGCSSLPFDEFSSAPPPEIRIVSLGHTEGCKLVSHVVGESTYPPDRDLYLAAMAHVRAKAAEQSANAVMVRTYQVESGPTGSRASIAADLYACAPGSLEGEN